MDVPRSHWGTDTGIVKLMSLDCELAVYYPTDIYEADEVADAVRH